MLRDGFGVKDRWRYGLRPLKDVLVGGSRETLVMTFAAVALFLCLFPLFLAKPGLPLSLKSDEPAYYLMALSLAKDFDLRCETKDIARLGSSAA